MSRSPNRTKFEVSDSAHNAYDVVFKTLSVLAGICIFFYGIYSYRQTRSDEYKAAFWEKQLEVYEILSTCAGTISMSDNQQLISEAEEQFWSLYNGKARLFIESAVDQEMTCFAAALRSYREGRTTNKVDLIQHSLNLALSCRASLSKSWGVELGKVSQTEGY
jgi:hypothetical protein